MQFCWQKDSLEFDGQRDGVEENVDLEDAKEEEAEMLKHLGKEIPEEADVRGQVWYWETEGRETRKSQTYMWAAVKNFIYVIWFYCFNSL